MQAMNNNNFLQILCTVLVVLVLILLYIVVSNKEPQQEQDVPLLAQPKQSPPPAILYFSAEGCPHCTDMAPKWAEAAQILRQSGKFIVREYSAQDETTQQMGVDGFPRVLYVAGPGAQPIKYKGDRTVESLLRFANSDGQNV